MLIPNYINAPLTDEEGEITDTWQILLSNLLLEMQTNLSNEGFVLPSQNTANATIIADAVTTLNGTTIYNSDIDRPEVRLADGNFHPIEVAGTDFFNNSPTPTPQETTLPYEYRFNVSASNNTLYSLALPAGKTISSIRNINSMLYSAAVTTIVLPNDVTPSLNYRVYVDGTNVNVLTGSSFSNAGSIYVWLYIV